MITNSFKTFKAGDRIAYDYWDERIHYTGTGKITRIVKYLEVPPIQIKDDLTDKEFRLYISEVKKIPS